MIPLTTLAAIVVLVLAAASDLRTRRIPNRLVLALAAVGALRLAAGFVAGGSVLAAGSDLLAAAALLTLGAGAFALRLVGGGDVKLLAAAALWLGAEAVPAFLLATALAGGLLACLYLAAAIARSAPAPSLPYGVAIAAGALAALPV